MGIGTVSGGVLGVLPACGVTSDAAKIPFRWEGGGEIGGWGVLEEESDEEERKGEEDRER